MKYIVYLFILFLTACGAAEEITIAIQEQCIVGEADESLIEARNTLKAKRIFFEDYFQSLHKSGVFNGSILLAEKGQIIYMGSFGYAHKTKKTPLDIETPYQLASVTKPFTAIAV